MRANIERKASGEQFIAEDTERVYVGACIERAGVAGDLFRTHVRQCPDQLPGGGLKGRDADIGIRHAGHSEVEDLGCPLSSTRILPGLRSR